MRNVKNVLRTGCFFLCLGGWVYSGQVSAADEASPAREAILNAAVAQAAAPGAAVEATIQEGTALAQATPPAVAAASAAPAPAASAPRTQAEPPDLSSTVFDVDVEGRLKALNIGDMDITLALRLFAVKTHRNIIASKNVKGTVMSVNLSNVTYMEALEAMLRPNGFDYVEKGNFIYVYTIEELDAIKKRDRKPVNQIFHLKYMNAQDANTLLKPMLSSTGIIALTPAARTGLESGSGNPGGMSLSTDDTLVISDFPENLSEIGAALRQLDVRPKQVLIEATVLNASMKDNNGLGIDLVSLSGLNFSDIGSIIGGSASSDTTSSTGVSTPGQLSGNMLANGNTQYVQGTNFAKDVPSGGLSVGFLSNHISVFMRALETVTDTTVVANPKILALNKQKGEVHIGQRLGYLTTSVTATSSQQTVSFLDIGTKLIFCPYIADDGYIRMEIHPEDSAGSLDSRGIPQTTTTEITSNVMIRDGRTIVIGGLFSETTSTGKGQVPILGNIPILGIPFRSTNDATTRQETIVLITPHIINDDTALYDESLKEQEDVQRMMLGNRAGLQPWGRDRIAHMWYTRAQEEAATGNTEKAIMFLDWSLNTNPRLMEAIKLRETLSKTKMNEKVGGTISDLVKNVLKDDAKTTPDKGGAGVYPPADKK
jgi:type IV pilus assembly protein PilQ